MKIKEYMSKNKCGDEANENIWDKTKAIWEIEFVHEQPM